MFLVNTTKNGLYKGMINLNNKIAITISIVSIILLGIVFGVIISDNKVGTNENIENTLLIEKKQEISAIQTVVEEERTTPNTLIIYKTYYTKCEHYIQRYEDIDVLLVNLNKKEFKEKKREWSIKKFSSEEIELSKEEESFCNEHYKLKLKNNVIVIYKVNEEGKETEYEQTGITTEYLTKEDILKLTTGIEIYGKENLTSTMEDYE